MLPRKSTASSAAVTFCWLAQRGKGLVSAAPGPDQMIMMAVLMPSPVW